jgi:hypothetical protein
MTDRIKGLTITLTKDYRVDDVQDLIHAIEQFKGVAQVDVSVANVDDHMNRVRIKQEMQKRLYQALD